MGGRRDAARVRAPWPKARRCTPSADRWQRSAACNQYTMIQPAPPSHAHRASCFSKIIGGAKSAFTSVKTHQNAVHHHKNEVSGGAIVATSKASCTGEDRSGKRAGVSARRCAGSVCGTGFEPLSVFVNGSRLPPRIEALLHSAAPLLGSANSARARLLCMHHSVHTFRSKKKVAGFLGGIFVHKNASCCRTFVTV